MGKGKNVKETSGGKRSRECEPGDVGELELQKYWAGDGNERKGEVGSDDVGDGWDLSNQWEMYESGSV